MVAFFKDKLFIYKALIGFIAIYPFWFLLAFVDNLGGKFDNVYMLLVLIFSLIIILAKYLTGKRIEFDAKNFLSFCFLLILVAINIYSIRYSKPFFFLSFFLFLSIALNDLKQTVWNPQKVFKIVSITYLGLSMFFLLLPWEGNRFEGFSTSPTVFSVFVNAFFIILLFTLKTNRNKIIAFLVSLTLILFSGTRLNLAFLIATPILYYILEKKLIKKYVIFLLFNIGLLALYPMYNFVKDFSIAQSFVKSRYEGSSRDASFGLRNHLSKLGNDYFLNQGITEKLFGSGSELTRELVVQDVGVDIFLHNDYLRLLIEFGIIFFIIYLFLLFRIARKSNFGFLFLLLYLFVFYHNMVYSMYFVSLMVIFSSSKTLATPDSKNGDQTLLGAK